MPNRGLFIPHAVVSQPRRWSDVHQHNVDLENLKKPITDFESAVKMYDSVIRLELEFNENKAVYTANSCAFSVKEVTADNFIINIDEDNDLFTSEYKLNVDDHVYLEMPKRYGPDRFKYAVGYVIDITKFQIEVVTYDRYKSFDVDEDQLIFLCVKVHYGLYADQLKALDSVKADQNVLQKLAYDEQIVTEPECEITDDVLEIVFDTDQKLALKQMTSDATTTFVLIGPPGTGKTTVTIEAVVKLVEKGKRVLLATSSNIAADAFTNRFLKRFDNHDRVFRLTKATRDFSKTDDKVKAISGFEKLGNEWEYRPPDSVERYSVVITTLGMSYKLRTMCEEPFSHIFIEEAGEAPELNIWKFLADHGGDKNTRLILCGDSTLLGSQNDVEQLNKYCSGYKKSMLQRLVEHPQFKSDSRLMVRLIKNYRSHEAIVDVMSTMFEDPIVASENFFEDFDLSQPSSRVIFHNVKSAKQEMQLVLEYFRKFQSLFADSDIGIITPHKSQAALIKQSFGSQSEVMIDAVHQFRGAEHRAVIISCTLDYDNLIYLKIDPEWFNMAVSRAQSLVIIIGRASLMDVLPDGAFSFLPKH